MASSTEQETDSLAHISQRNTRKSYRPELTPATVKQLTRSLYGLHVKDVRELDSYDDRNYHVTVDEGCGWDNTNVSQLWPHGYVLKVLNSLDSHRADVIGAKNRMIVEAAKKGFPTPRPVPTVSGELFCLQPLKRETAQHAAGNGESDVYLIRLMEYLPGQTLASVPLTTHLAFQVGVYAGKLDVALKDFDASGCPELVVLWNMQTIPSLRPLLTYIGDDEKMRTVSQVIDHFEQRVLQRGTGLQTGMIHSDFNDYNILVQPADDAHSPSADPSYSVCGILDFGDATKSFLIIEVAVAMTYMAVQCPSDLDPDEMAGHVLAGYLSEVRLSQEEVELLPLTVCARLGQSLTNGFHRLCLEPDNPYCLVHANKVWPHLHRLWSRPVSHTLDTWRTVALTHGILLP